MTHRPSSDPMIRRLDVHLTSWMARHGVSFLRLSLGAVFLWFGVLKFFPDLSPAQDLASRTISFLTFGTLPPTVSLPYWQPGNALIGLGLLFGVMMRVVLLLMFVQMAGTVALLCLFPGEVFARFPFVPTLEGQYIIKSLALVSAGIVIGATVSGGNLVAESSAREDR